MATFLLRSCQNLRRWAHKKQEPHSTPAVNLSQLKLRQYVEVLQGDSVEMSKQIQSAYFVYLDGDHSYEKVIEEINEWKDKTKVLAGHDYYCSGVQRAVHESFGDKVKLMGINSWLVEF